MSRNCYLKSSKGRNSESINTRIMVLALCMLSHDGQDLYMYKVSKLHKDTLNDFVVTERT